MRYALLLAVVPTFLSAATTVSGTISSDAIWDTSGSPYVVTSNVTVAGGVTLTILPGAIVKLSGANAFSSGLFVTGSLVANGTALQPIVFTSIKDDSVGGDTNGDGTATKPAAGDWGWIYFEPGSTASISNAIVRYGGIYGNPFSMVVINTSGGVSITNSTLTDSANAAVYIQGSGVQPTISGSTFARNGTGIVATIGTAGTISNNVVSTTTNETAMSIDVNFLGSLSGNTASGSGLNAVLVNGGTLAGKATWGQTSMPYYVVNNASVGTSGTLTISPGAIVKLSGGNAFSAGLYVQGNLVANGTALQPIVFTSIKDDSEGGDTNGDGTATKPAAGDWGQIYFEPGSTASISNAIVRYGGIYGNPFSMVVIDTSGSVSITNSTLSDSVSAAVYIEGSGVQPTISGNTFARNSTGIVGTTGAAGTISNNVFTTTANETAISIDANFLGSLSGSTANGSGLNAVVVNGGTLAGKATWGQSSMAYYVVNDPIVGSTGALTIGAGAIVKLIGSPANSLSAGLFVTGSLVANGTALQPIVFTSIKDDSVGGDTNGDGTATKPAAGDWGQIYFEPGSTASISNAIVRYGGIYGNPFSMVVIDTSGSVSITNSTLSDSVSAAVYIEGSGVQPTISGNTFARNSTGISVSGGATPHIHNNSFQLDSSYGVLNVDCPSNSTCSTTPTVDATNNYWGSSSGPWLNPPPGSGDRVSYHVTYIPFSGFPSGTGASLQQTLLGQPGSSGFTFEPINTATGNYYFAKNELVVSGKGFGFIFTRSYNSLDSYSGPLGTGWTHSFNVFLTAGGGSVSVKEADGHQVAFVPTGGGNYSAATPGVFDTLNEDGDGTFTLTRKNQTHLSFSSGGKLTSIVDRNGNALTLSHDGSGNLISVVDTSGRTFTFTNDGSGRITGLSDPTGRTWQYDYDGGGNLISVQDAAGGITRYTYDASHRMTSATDQRNVTYLQNTYDSLGRVVAQTNARSFTTALTYGSPVPGTTSFTDPSGNITQHVYDSALRLVGVIDALGGNIAYAYDANNDRTSVTNQNGKTTQFSYDGRGNVTQIVDALADATGFTYDAINDLLTATNPKGNTTTFSYDPKGNLTAIHDALGHATSFSYDGSGLLFSKTDARGNTTGFTYDATGNLIRVTDALGKQTSLSYDGVGRLISTTDPNAHTAAATYDALNRLQKITDPLGNAKNFSYDPIGNLLKLIDANGTATAYAYDPTNNLAAVTDALSQVTTYAYDANNKRTGFTNAKGNTTSYGFDALGRLVQITDPLLLGTSYAYDAVGNVRSTTDANGKTNHFSYDALNRLTNIAYADGTTVGYAYDANGNRTTMVDSHGTTTYAYDILDRLTAVLSPSGKTVAYGFDAAGNRQTVQYPDSKTLTYAYDPANRLEGVTDWLGRHTSYGYDPAGNLLSTAYPNTAVLSFAYDAANRLHQITNVYQGSIGNPASQFTYALDAVGNRLSTTDGAGAVTLYGYDGLYELTSANVSGKVTQYAYDAVGNRLSLTAPGTSVSYTYDAADRLLKAGSNNFTYDANGNQITKTTSAGTQTFAYDAANRLIAVTGGGTNSAFAYDGDGNRVSQTVPSGTYNYINDVATSLAVVLQESGPDGNISYSYGLNRISESGSGFDYFYQYDGLGSVAGITDPTSKLEERYVYDALGETLRVVPSPKVGTDNKFEYTGEALDPGTGLYYLRARYYDPSDGRFTTRDPIPGSVLLPEALNKYQYALSNPIRFADPSGYSAIDAEAAGNAQSTLLLAPNPGSTCSLDCISAFVENVGTALGVGRPLNSLATTVGTFYPIFTVPFELAQQFANGADRATALLNVGVQQLVETGIPLAALELFGGSADVFATVALFAFNYGLPSAR